MSRRITSKNYDSKIKDIIKNCIPSCKNIYFRVGYFYFSGFSLIADVIKNKNVKILIGMDTDNTISKLVNKSNQEIQNYYFNDFMKKSDSKPGKFCKENFSYNSLDNHDFVNVNQLRKMKENFEKDI